MTKEDIHKNWWNGDRDKESCCEGIGIGYEYQKRIAELEETNADLKQSLDWANEREHDDYVKMQELVKENELLRCECLRCAYSDTPCVRSDYEKNDKGICKHFKDVFEENAELKKENEDTQFINMKVMDENSTLEKENTELKETLKTYNGCGDWDNEFHTCRVYLQREELQNCVEQLNKAIEIIRKYHKECPSKYSFEDIDDMAEQFLNSEVGK